MRTLAVQSSIHLAQHPVIPDAVSPEVAEEETLDLVQTTFDFDTLSDEEGAEDA